MTAPQRINVDGGYGGDWLAGFSTSGQRGDVPVTLQGGEDSDWLFGGNANDLLMSGKGDADFINSVGGDADVVTGDEGLHDQALVDASDTVSTIELETVQ